MIVSVRSLLVRMEWILIDRERQLVRSSGTVEEKISEALVGLFSLNEIFSFKMGSELMPCRIELVCEFFVGNLCFLHEF